MFAISLSCDSLLSPVSKSRTFKAAPPVPQYTFLPSKVRSFFSSLPQSRILEGALSIASSTNAGENLIIPFSKIYFCANLRKMG